jgi:hypothetical protein
VTVVEKPPRGGHRTDADPVLVGGVQEVAALEHLQVPELPDDD